MTQEWMVGVMNQKPFYIERAAVLPLSSPSRRLRSQDVQDEAAAPPHTPRRWNDK